jgi:hypothetical protein
MKIPSNDTASKTEIVLKDVRKLELLFEKYYFDVSETTCEKFRFSNRYRAFCFSKLAKKKNNPF